MSESKPASVVFTNGSLLAKNAQKKADNAKSAAEKAQELAYSAQKTADGKNRVFRGSDPSTVPTAGLKEGDIYFTDNALYTWDGVTWEKTVSDTTGEEIHAKVEAAMRESQKAVADLKSDVEAKAKKLDDEIAQTKIQTGNALSFYKEQYYLSSSYTELEGGSWSDEVPPRKVEGKYVWSRYVTANVGNPTNHQYSDPVCISGLDGEQGPQGVPGPKGADGQTTYVHFAYANSADGKIDFNVSYFNNALYVGTYTDYNPTDSNDYTKYTWNRLKGDTGATGATGPQGADGTDAPTITVKSYTFSAANGARADIELTGPNAFKQTVYSRGHNVWVLDAKTHKLKEFVNCDTYTSMSFNHNGVNTTLADYLASLTDSIVVIAAADADTADQNVRNVLNSMGGSPELGTWVSSRFGHVFIGMSKRSDGTWPLQPQQGYEEVDKRDGSAPETGCALSNGGIVANGATGPKGDTGDTGFFIGTTPPPNPSKGTVWATNDASGNMVSAKTWDGSNWVSTAFTQDLVAGNITATKIQGGELDINKFTVKNAQNIPVTSTVSLGKKLSDIEQNADGLKLTTIGGGNLLNNTSDTLKEFTSNDWMFYASSADEPIAKHQLDGQTVTLSAWIENPSKEAWVQMLTDKGRFQGNKIPAGSKGWSQVTYTMPSGFTYWNIVVGCGDGSGTITLSYSSLQLELGPNRTAWSQSTADVSTIQQTANSINAYVRGSNGSKTLDAILSMDPNNSTIGQVVNGHVVAAINTSSDGSVKIDGKTLHITADTKIENATIHAANIDSVDASTITTGKLDASKIEVVNLDADSITTGSFRAALYKLSDFQNYTISPSSPWDFDQTKTNGKWFLNGEWTGEHVYNGPMVYNGPDDKVGHKLNPWMYVICQANSDGSRITVTVWKDDDPTQYQRVWNGSSWSQWVMLPNSQNLVSAINLSPDSVKISGKNIELDGNTRIASGFTLSADKIESGTLNGVTITGSTFVATGTQKVLVDDSGFEVGVERGSKAKLYAGGLEITTNNNDSLGERLIDLAILDKDTGPYITIRDDKRDSETYINSGFIKTPDARIGPIHISYHHIRSDATICLSNDSDSNFNSAGSVGLQIESGIGLGQNTLYTHTNDLYIQKGIVVNGGSYASASKTTVHCNKVVSQVANTVSSRLSVKTDITPVTYDRALAAVEGTDMYDYRYVSDDSGQHYVSGIIDDVNPEPQYHMDGMLINKERTARIDANLVGYHHVVIQKLLERVAALEEKAK